MSTFQTILIGVSVVAIIIGVVLFASTKTSFVGTESNVVIWGTVEEEYMERMRVFYGQNDLDTKFTYVYKDPAFFEQQFIEALADGTGPDLVLLPHELIYDNKNRVYPIPYETLPERTFKDTYIQQGELYLTSKGTLGIPFSVDPIVMYWNRSLFNNEGIAKPPQFWDEIPTLVSKITRADSTKTITKSLLAIGEYQNVAHAKEILTTLIMQAGGNVTERGQNDVDEVRIAQMAAGTTRVPADSAVAFYVQFANPAKDLYSWNRALPASTDFFIAGDLGIYFGYASELQTLRVKNPNLNFDVAPMIQSRDGGEKVTFGRMLAFAITKDSLNKARAYEVIKTFLSAEAQNEWSRITTLPPVRRDLLENPPQNSYSPVFYLSALWSRAFRDPEPQETDAIFKSMIESIVSGRSQTKEAVGKAQAEIQLLMK